MAPGSRKARGGFWLPTHTDDLDAILLVESALDALAALRLLAPTLPPDTLLASTAGIATSLPLWLQAFRAPRILCAYDADRAGDQDPELEFRTRQGAAARAWRLRTADGESELCLWSEQRQAKDDAILAQHRERFEGELQALHEGLAKKGCTKC